MPSPGSDDGDVISPTLILGRFPGEKNQKSAMHLFLLLLLFIYLTVGAVNKHDHP